MPTPGMRTVTGAPRVRRMARSRSATRRGSRPSDRAVAADSVVSELRVLTTAVTPAVAVP